MPTRVVHCMREPFDVYIGRKHPRFPEGSKWANPFRIDKDGTREEVIAKYEAWLLTQPELYAALPELRGKVLGCWCHPKPCHGDVLARLADQAKAVGMKVFVSKLGQEVRIKARAEGEEGVIGDLTVVIKPDSSFLGHSYEWWAALPAGEHIVAVPAGQLQPVKIEGAGE